MSENAKPSRVSMWITKATKATATKSIGGLKKKIKKKMNYSSDKLMIYVLQALSNSKIQQAMGSLKRFYKICTHDKILCCTLSNYSQRKMVRLNLIKSCQ